LTFTCDVGIEIAGCDIVEKATGSSKAIYGMLGKIKPLSFPRDYDEFLSDEKNRRLLAAYREGMNATNVFYQALTFAKVIEGMTKTIPRPDNSGAIDSRRRYMSTRIPAELSDLPVTSNEIVETFRPFLGKKFSWVREHFRPLVRNAIAHLDPDEDTLDIDRIKDVQTCERAVPVLRYIARSLLLQVFEDWSNKATQHGST